MDDLTKIIVGTIMPTFVGYFAAWYREKKRQNKNAEHEYSVIKDGLQSLLRDRMIQAYGHYAEEKGFAPIYAQENFERMHRSYKELGGNGVLDGLYEKFSKLPDHPEEQ